MSLLYVVCNPHEREVKLSLKNVKKLISESLTCGAFPNRGTNSVKAPVMVSVICQCDQAKVSSYSNTNLDVVVKVVR